MTRISSRKALVLTAFLISASLAHSDTGLRHSISDLIAATQKLQSFYSTSCKSGDSDACDIAMLDDAYIDTLRVEQKHIHNSKVQDALDEAGERISDARKALTGDD